MRRPFSFIIIPLILGILFSYYWSVNILIVFFVTILLMAVYIINILRYNNHILLSFILLLFLGITLSTFALSNSDLAKVVDRNLIFSGTIDKVIESHEGLGKYIIKIDLIEEGLLVTKTNEKLVLKIIGDRDLDLGHRLKFRGKLSIPQENTNPKLFNYRLNLLTNGIHTRATIKDYSIIEEDKENISLKYKLRTSFKKKVEGVFDDNLNEKNSSTIKSIVLGEYSYLDEENILRYRELGLAHILAVSGLHIGIIAGFITIVLGNIGVKRRYNVLITLSVIWVYGFLIGFPPSILRANIMFTMLFCSQLLAEPYDTINTLSFAAFILLIIYPLWIFNIGFQLSFLATFSIVYFTPKVGRMLYPHKNKLVSTLSALLGVQIGLMPIQAYYFNKISLLSIIANLLIAPILSLSLILAGLMLGLPILNPIIGRILDFLLNTQDYLMEILFKFPWSIMKIHSPSMIEIIIYYILILIVMGEIRLKELNIKVKKLIFYYLLFFLVCNSIAVVNDKSLEVHFIDVGQGDGILLKTSRWNYLIDTGGSIMDSFDVGKNITLPYLQKLGIRDIKGVFITHFHDDHCKSLPVLMDNIRINNILLSYTDVENQVYKKILENDIPIKILEEGNTINLDKNISLEVLSPNFNMKDKGFSPNNLSLVFLLSYYDKTILFTGDMEKEVEWEIVQKFNLPIDIIKVPHHGSSTSSTEELLNKIQPKIGIISVGRNNLYGHPANGVIERYDDIGTQLYRTDRDGMIKLLLNKKDLTIIPFVGVRSKFIGLINDNFFLIIFNLSYYLALYILTKIFVNLEEEMSIDELH